VTLPNDVTPKMIVEAVLFSAERPLTIGEIRSRIVPRIDVASALADLGTDYEGRSVMLVETGHGWCIRTNPEHSDLCRKVMPPDFRLTKAAMETLSVIAYFQPVTRSEIETIRGVALGKGTMDMLVWSGLVRPGPRRQSPGTPMTFLTTDMFLERFDVRSLEDLPGIETLKTSGLLDTRKIGSLAIDPLERIDQVGDVSET
jgi:segregation and condensation protein B